MAKQSAPLLRFQESAPDTQHVGPLRRGITVSLPFQGLGRPKRPRVPEKAQRSFAAAAADEADLFLAPLSCQLKLCILSGEGDCGVSRRLPQPALPFAIFPRCRRLEVGKPRALDESALPRRGPASGCWPCWPAFAAGSPQCFRADDGTGSSARLLVHAGVDSTWRPNGPSSFWTETASRSSGGAPGCWTPSPSQLGKRPRLGECCSSREIASRRPGSGYPNLSLGAALRWQLFASPTSRLNRPSCSSTRRTSPSRSSASKSPRPQV
eukprot:s5916_g3.t1